MLFREEKTELENRGLITTVTKILKGDEIQKPFVGSYLIETRDPETYYNLTDGPT